MPKQLSSLLSPADLPQNFGIVRRGTSDAALQPIPTPVLPKDYVLVQTVAVAINPTDYTTLDAPGDSGTLVGCDYAGIVIAVGAAVTKPFKPGDRICGFAHGANDLEPWSGAFARFIVVKGDIQIKIPDNVSWEAASTTGVAFGTSTWALWKELQLSMPQPGASKPENSQWVLIYGGSTATGTIAIQLAKLSGYKVITTASPKHRDLLFARGADVVLDYRYASVGDQIKAHTSNSLQHVLDCVAIPSSAAICAESFGPEGGLYCSLLPEQCPHPKVKSTFFLGYSLSGEDYVFESELYQAVPEMYYFGVEAMNLVEKLWAQDKITAHPQRVGGGGLRGILHGLKEIKEGRVSGVKLVYRIDETVWPGVDQ